MCLWFCENIDFDILTLILQNVPNVGIDIEIVTFETLKVGNGLFGMFVLHIDPLLQVT